MFRYCIVMGGSASKQIGPPSVDIEDPVGTPSEGRSSPLRGRNLKRKFDDERFVSSPSDARAQPSNLRPRLLYPAKKTPSGDRPGGGLVADRTRKYQDHRAAVNEKKRLFKPRSPVLEWLGKHPKLRL